MFSAPPAPDKPLTPDKFVSDSDEGTNTPTEVGTDKSVKHDLLKNRYEQYHYQIVHSIPRVKKDNYYSSYELDDKLDKILDIDKNVKVYNREGQDVTDDFTISNNDNDLKVVAKNHSLQREDFYDETYKVLFDAKVKPGVSLKDHADPKHKDQAVIYNDATVKTNNGSATSSKTTTNIPFVKPDTKKTVSNDGKGNTTKLDNVDFGKRYVYKAVAAVPDDVDLSSLSIKNKIHADWNYTYQYA